MNDPIVRNGLTQAEIDRYRTLGAAAAQADPNRRPLTPDEERRLRVLLYGPAPLHRTA